MFRTVDVVRYVLPFREGSSMPALVEADDLGLYVAKFRGAGQGPKALLAELLAGELGRALGFHVPELVLLRLDGELAKAEPDPDISDLLEASVGVNVGLDYLPGSITFDPIRGPFPSPELASRILLFDAFITNVDRSPRNPNMLVWHRKLFLIDHGAAFYFHHGWTEADRTSGASEPFGLMSSHVLLPFATQLDDARDHLASTLTKDVIENAVAKLPESLLDYAGGFDDPQSHRAAYAAWLNERVRALPLLKEEAENARASLV